MRVAKQLNKTPKWVANRSSDGLGVLDGDAAIDQGPGFGVLSIGPGNSCLRGLLSGLTRYFAVRPIFGGSLGTAPLCLAGAVQD